MVHEPGRGRCVAEWVWVVSALLWISIGASYCLCGVFGFANRETAALKTTSTLTDLARQPGPGNSNRPKGNLDGGVRGRLARPTPAIRRRHCLRGTR